MSRRPIATRAAITRALKAAQAAGLKVGRLEVERDKIVIYSKEDAGPEATSALDTWRAKRDAR